MKDILLVCETKDKAKVEFERMRDFFSFMIKSSNTNAITESLNKVSKEISAQGRGYNFNVLRAKLLYRNEAAKPAKFAYHEPQRPSTGVMQDMTFTFMTPFFGKKKSVEVGAGTDIDVLSEQISKIVEIRQRLGRINRYANKFKYWDEPKEDKE